MSTTPRDRTPGGWPEGMPLTGPDRVRLAIARDRGEYAPRWPVVLCGQPDDTAMRADDERWAKRISCAHRFRRQWLWRRRTRCIWCGFPVPAAVRGA